LPTGLYILLALIFFFFFFFFVFLMISQRQIISGSAEPFLQSFHRMKAFWVQMIDLDLFFDISRDFAMATDFVKKGKLCTFIALAFRNRMG